MTPAEKIARTIPPSVPPAQRLIVLTQVMQKMYDLNITATLEDDDETA